jgi:DNA-binding Xre family transcriptional regulator
MKERYYNGINEMNNVATDVITRLCKSLDIEPAPYLKELKDLREGKA